MIAWAIQFLREVMQHLSDLEFQGLDRDITQWLQHQLCRYPISTTNLRTQANKSLAIHLHLSSSSSLSSNSQTLINNKISSSLWLSSRIYLSMDYLKFNSSFHNNSSTSNLSLIIHNSWWISTLKIRIRWKLWTNQGLAAEEAFLTNEIVSRRLLWNRH